MLFRRDLEHDAGCLSYYHGGHCAPFCFQDVLPANLCRVAFARFTFYSRRGTGEMRTHLVHDPRDCGIDFATIDDRVSSMSCHLNNTIARFGIRMMLVIIV